MLISLSMFTFTAGKKGTACVGSIPAPQRSAIIGRQLLSRKEGLIGLNNHRTTRAGVPVPGLHTAGLDMVLGAAAGAVGVWAMDQVGWFMLRSENMHTLTRDLRARDGDADGNAGTAAQIRGVQAGTPGRPATAGALRKATQVSGVSPTDQQPGPGATVFHYALGMLPGALYGAVRRIRPSVRTGSGVLYGLALFVVMDETAQVSGVSPTHQRPGPGATVFHYALGMLPGALYGAVRRIRPWVRTGHGVLYGVALFVVMDETAAPLTGIASGPGRYPWQAHARGLAAHIVLGMTTEVLLRATDRFR